MKKMFITHKFTLDKNNIILGMRYNNYVSTLMLLNNIYNFIFIYIFLFIYFYFLFLPG